MARNRYVAKIARLDWKGLNSLWRQIARGRSQGWPAGKALEHLLLRAFELDGATVTWPYSVRIDGQEVEQIDGAIYCNGLNCIVECKDTAHPINVEALAKLRNQLLRRPGSTLGLLVSRGGFTAPAQTLAQYLWPHTILLLGGDELGYLISKRIFRAALERKYRYCVEHGIPDYDLRAEAFP